jgi:RNA polymerase sigma-70 factor (ECF subfamily)
MHRTADDFINLLKPHYNSAAQYCRALFQGSRNAEDGLQDALVTAMQNFSTLKDESRFRSWLFTIITRTFYATKKREGKKEKLFTLLREKDDVFPDVYEPDCYSAKEGVLMAALNTLTEKERTAILLFEIAGFSLVEIQHIQGESSLSAVKSRLSRTREKLRNTITLLEQTNQQGGTYDFKNSVSGF